VQSYQQTLTAANLLQKTCIA